MIQQAETGEATPATLRKIAAFLIKKAAYDPVTKRLFDGRWESLLLPEDVGSSIESSESSKPLSLSASLVHVGESLNRDEEEGARVAGPPEDAAEAGAFAWPKKEPVTLLGRFYRAAPHFARECLSRAPHTQKLRLRWLGMAMQFGGPFLPDLLRRITESASECEIELLIAMLDPDWIALRDFHPDWSGQAKTYYESLNRHREAFSHGEGKNVSITICRYQYIPTLHGFVIDDSLFYISICSWFNNMLQGGENVYALVRPGEGREFDNRMAHAFNGWFEYAFGFERRQKAP